MKAEYIDHMGSDDLVVDAARASFGNVAKNYPEEKNTKLIQYLAKHNHWSPFSHPQVTMLHEVPIFVARQEFKHVVGFTRNERSRRYVDDVPMLYMPDAWRVKAANKKQGSGSAHSYSHGWTRIVGGLYEQIVKTYNSMIEDGVAPEQARMILPQSMLTSYYVTGSLAAWARAYKLRIAEDSQKEIQYLAKQWGTILEPLFPVSWRALT